MRLQEAKLEHLGRAKSIEASKYNTTIVGGNGSQEEIDKRIDVLKAELAAAEDMRECEQIQERITRLSSGIAIINVGGATEVEMIEKKHRIEDAVSTTKAAIESGVVAGGGVTLLRARSAVLDAAASLEGDEATGANLVARSLSGPLSQIAVNAGLDGGVVVARVAELEGSNGLNAATGEYEDLVAAGVIDAAKVTLSALQNAASIAALFLTTEVVIVDQPSEGGMPAMPDMDF